MGCPLCKQKITRLKVGTYEWDVLFINNKTSGLKRVPIDGMFCLQTIKHVVKRGYLWVGCPVYKR
jgi:hypothetical protein